MRTIKLDVSDKIFDNIMFFLNQLPKSDLTIKVIPTEEKKDKSKGLVEFFRSSPIVDEIIIERSSQSYSDRVQF